MVDGIAKYRIIRDGCGDLTAQLYNVDGWIHYMDLSECDSVADAHICLQASIRRKQVEVLGHYDENGNELIL